ncbi:MAG: SPASM domain-containing protein [Magnetovibrio sp.]|nr:SPASM domain-containing protein [Magnetovibrio sp.]
MTTLREIRRSIGNFLAINWNRLSGREFVPHPRRTIFVETSGRCNLACRFCAYPKSPPGALMDDEAFAEILDEVCAMGFSQIHPTPMLGDAFADPGLLRKFDAMEAEERVAAYSFYTNFILAREAQIRALPRYRKMNALYISIYGYDAETFTETTRKGARQFDKLVANLKVLEDLLEDWRPADGVHFNVRTKHTGASILAQGSELSDLMRRLSESGRATVTENVDYDTWGGMIDQSEVDPLGIQLTDGRNIYMRGACFKIFGEVQIKADGQVHACACRDVDGSLRLGDLRETPLAEILSSANPRYRALIEAQMRGEFSENCRSCSMYRSVYDHRPSDSGTLYDVLAFDEAFEILDRPATPDGKAAD